MTDIQTRLFVQAAVRACVERLLGAGVPETTRASVVGALAGLHFSAWKLRDLDAEKPVVAILLLAGVSINEVNNTLREFYDEDALPEVLIQLSNDLGLVQGRNVRLVLRDFATAMPEAESSARFLSVIRQTADCFLPMQETLVVELLHVSVLPAPKKKDKDNSQSTDLEYPYLPNGLPSRRTLQKLADELRSRHGLHTMPGHCKLLLTDILQRRQQKGDPTPQDRPFILDGSCRWWERVFCLMPLALVVRLGLSNGNGRERH